MDIFFNRHGAPSVHLVPATVADGEGSHLQELLTTLKASVAWAWAMLIERSTKLKGEI